MSKKKKKKTAVFQEPPHISDYGPIIQAELEIEPEGPAQLYFIRHQDNVFLRNEWGKIFFVDEGLVLNRDNVPVHFFANIDALRNYIISLTGCELTIINPIKSLNP